MAKSARPTHADATWILVANRVRARLFRAEGVHGPLEEIGTFVNPLGRLPSGTRGEHRPDRVQESFGSARHAIEPHTTPAAKIADRFARQLCTILEDGRVHHLYGQLVLMAPPRFLGHLHGVMDGHPLHELVHAEIRRDLTRNRAERVAAALADSGIRAGTPATGRTT